MTKKKYGKPKMICPFCQERKDNGNFRAFSTNGMSMHVRQIHPESYDDFQTHRDQYIAKFACDDEGVLTGGQPADVEVPEVEPVMVEEAIPEQEYIEPEESVPTPPPVKTPKKIKPEPEVPKKEEFPDEREPDTGSDRYSYNPYGY